MPLTPEPATPAKASRGGSDSFERGLAALAQYKDRTGTVGPVSRSHIERIVIDGEEHAIKLGVWIMNLKGRRAKLTADKLQALAALGADWAA